MIIDAVYCKNEFVYRIYLDGKIIWDCGSYMNGNTLLSVLSGTVPEIQAPLEVEMHERDGILDNCESYTRTVIPGIGTPHDISVASYTPDSIDAQRSDYRATLRVLTIGEPARYGLAFSEGFGSTKVDAIYSCNKAGTVFRNGHGKYSLSSFQTASKSDAVSVFTDEGLKSVFQFHADRSDISNVSMNTVCSGPMDGMPKSSDFESTNLMCNLVDQFQAVPEIKTVCQVTFMLGEDVIYECSVIEGSDCIDPVEARIITAPATIIDGKRYVFLGWSRYFDGLADTASLNNITNHTTIYAVLEEQMSGSLDDTNWSTISEHSKAGVAEDHYNVGDSKKILLMHPDNTMEHILVFIAGFNLHRDETGVKSGITWIAQWRSTKALTKDENIDYIFDSLPQDLSGVILMSKIDAYSATSSDSLAITTRDCLVFEPEITNIANSVTAKDGTTEIWDGLGFGLMASRYCNDVDADPFPFFQGMNNDLISNFFDLKSTNDEIRSRTLRFGKVKFGNSYATINSREILIYDQGLYIDIPRGWNHNSIPHTFCFRT